MSAKAPTKVPKRIGRPRLYRTDTIKRSLRIPVRIDRRARMAAANDDVSLSFWVAAAISLALRRSSMADIETELALLRANRGSIR